MPRSPKSPTPHSRPPPMRSPPGWSCAGSRTPATPTRCSRSGDITRSSPTPTPRRAGRHHPPPPRHHRDRIRRPHRRTLAHLPSGRFGANCRLGPVRGDRPQPAARRRRPRRRPAHPRPRSHATPQDCHRPGPAGPTPAPTDPAPAHPLALVETLAYTVAQHDRNSPPQPRQPDHPPKGPTEANRKSWADQQIPHAHTPRIKITSPSATRPGPSVGWPGGIAPPGSHRSRRDSLPSPGSCPPGHQTRATEGTHVQCANIRGYRAVIPRQHSMAFFSARSRRYFVRIQRTR